MLFERDRVDPRWICVKDAALAVCIQIIIFNTKLVIVNTKSINYNDTYFIHFNRYLAGTLQCDRDQSIKRRSGEAAVEHLLAAGADVGAAGAVSIVCNVQQPVKPARK